MDKMTKRKVFWMIYHRLQQNRRCIDLQTNRMVSLRCQSSAMLHSNQQLGFREKYSQFKLHHVQCPTCTRFRLYYVIRLKTEASDEVLVLSFSALLNDHISYEVTTLELWSISLATTRDAPRMKWPIIDAEQSADYSSITDDCFFEASFKFLYTH